MKAHLTDDETKIGARLGPDRLMLQMMITPVLIGVLVGVMSTIRLAGDRSICARLDRIEKLQQQIASDVARLAMKPEADR